MVEHPHKETTLTVVVEYEGDTNSSWLFSLPCLLCGCSSRANPATDPTTVRSVVKVIET